MKKPKSRDVLRYFIDEIDLNEYETKSQLIKYLMRKSGYSYSTIWKYLEYEYENEIDVDDYIEKEEKYFEEITWGEDDHLLDFGKYDGRFISSMNTKEEKLYLRWLYHRSLSIINAIENHHID